MESVRFVTAVARVAGQLSAFAMHSFRAIRDPTDADAVAAVGELSSLEALENMKRKMMGDRDGRAILHEQPMVTDDVLEMARAQPEGSFGQHYAAYMDHNHFTPSGRTPVRYILDPTLAYVMTRYRQCHDFLHTVSAAGRSVEEELAVKLLEWHHTGLPLGLLAVAGGAPHLDTEQRENMRVYWQWAADLAPSSVHGEKYVPFYLNVQWEEMMPRPVAEVREITGLTSLPDYLTEKGIIINQPRK